MLESAGHTGVCVVTPTGTLGYGFSVEDFERILVEEAPDAIAVDAGSTDPGPYYLGAGDSSTSRLVNKQELEVLIGAALRYNIPLIVGSCGAAGAEPHLRWVEEVVEELAVEHSWSFSLATISADVPPGVVEARRRSGDIHPLDHDAELTAADVAGATRIVAQMGFEPIVEALCRGAQIVLAGRACDDAVMAAYPIFRGCDLALALHMGKLLECGALAAEPIGMDTLVGRLGPDYFDLVPGSPGRACTPLSVASHALYEREDPIRQQGPGGCLDLAEVNVEPLTARVARVRGARYTPSSEYFVKLEGVRRVGSRAIAVAGVRCPAMIDRIDAVLDETRRRVDDYFREHTEWYPDGSIQIHVYGRNGVMGNLEPVRHAASHELGLVIEAVADTSELAKTVCHRVAGTLLHLDFEGQMNNAGNLAFPFSPAVFPLGEAYEFSIYHLMRLDDPLELFPIKMRQVRSQVGA